MYKNRLSRLREHFSQGGIDALLISSNFNRAYLSGFQGTSGWLIITSDEQILVTDFRYLNQARSEAIDYQIVLYKTSLPEKINDLLKERKIQKLGFESQHLTYEQYHKFKSQLEVDLIPVSSPVEKLRELKDPAEIERIKNAVSVADKTFEHILKFIKPGVTERDLAAEMEYFMRKEGAGGSFF
jgi:Xaa-Pro aminopeptidase